jgi:hypothetical protein
VSYNGLASIFSQSFGLCPRDIGHLKPSISRRPSHRLDQAAPKALGEYLCYHFLYNFLCDLLSTHAVCPTLYSASQVRYLVGPTARTLSSLSGAGLRPPTRHGTMFFRFRTYLDAEMPGRDAVTAPAL